MNSLNEIRFKSRECKNKMHKDCNYEWHGLGFEFLCMCECGHYEKRGMLEHSDCANYSTTSSQNQPLQQHGVLLDD